MKSRCRFEGVWFTRVGNSHQCVDFSDVMAKSVSLSANVGDKIKLELAKKHGIDNGELFNIKVMWNLWIKGPFWWSEMACVASLGFQEE